MTTSKNVRKYRDEIYKLADVTLHFTFCDRKSETFYIVPTEFLIDNIEDRELWHGCPSLVNFDLRKCITDIIHAREYPYNASVGQLFCDIEHTFLSAVIYCTQQYY